MTSYREQALKKLTDEREGVKLSGGASANTVLSTIRVAHFRSVLKPSTKLLRIATSHYPTSRLMRPQQAFSSLAVRYVITWI